MLNLFVALKPQKNPAVMADCSRRETRDPRGPACRRWDIDSRIHASPFRAETLKKTTGSCTVTAHGVRLSHWIGRMLRDQPAGGGS
jgi:hypothetical protein